MPTRSNQKTRCAEIELEIKKKADAAWAEIEKKTKTAA
jgi:hypothetical protein